MRMKRLPNNYGNIRKFTGNRSKPYAAYTPLVYTNGQRKRQALGYFETYAEALSCLADYNKTQCNKINYTLAELYEEWSETAYNKLSKSTEDCYKAAWKNFKPIEKNKVKYIKTADFQFLIDSNSDKSFSSLHKIKLLAGLLEKYAMQNDIIDKNYAEFVELPTEEKEEKNPFSMDDLKKLIKGAEANVLWSRDILILCLSGWRIAEYLELTKENYIPDLNAFKGGKKTKNGKNRIVPVHSMVDKYVKIKLNNISQYVTYREDSISQYVIVTPNYFRKYCFQQTLDALGIKGKFSPHSTRHTFATLCHHFGVDPIVTKQLLGHSKGDTVTEKVYTHISNEDLRAGIEKINL